MSNGTNKDWLDALREKSFSEGAAPAPASWETVGRRVRRAAALRRGGITAAALLPVAALLLWAPWHRPAAPLTVTPGEPLVAQELPAEPLPEAATAVVPAPAGDLPVVPKTPARPTRTGSAVTPDPTPAVSPDAPAVVTPDTPAEVVPVPTGEPDGPASAPETVPDVQAPVTPAAVTPDPAGELPDPFLLAEADTPARRPRISVGVRAGAGTDRSQTEIPVLSNMKLVTLNYMNSMPVDALKSTNGIPNLSGEILYGYVLDNMRQNSRNNPYFRHDIPVTLGLSVRMGLTSRIGLESGLEYTYLHSVEEYGNQRLDQRLHFIGIPLRADVRLWSLRGFDVYAGLGAKMEKCFAASLGVVASREPRLQWSAEAFLGLQYRLGPWASLYFQPELSYYFTKTELVTARTENPLSLSLQAGFRFDL